MAGTVNSWNNQILGSYNNIVLNAGTNDINIGTDTTTSNINIGTGTGAKSISIGFGLANKSIIIGVANGTTSVDIESGSGGATVNSVGGSVTLAGSAGITVNSGGGDIGIGNQADPHNINIGTGAANRTITIGNVTTTTAVNVNTGTAGTTYTTTNGIFTLATGTGAITISDDAAATTLKFGTGGAAKAVTIGSTNTTSGLTLNSGSGGIKAIGVASVSVANKNYVTINTSTGALGSDTGPSSSITITGDSGGGLTGNSFTFTGGSTGLTFAGAGSTETLGGTLAIANGGTNATSMTNTDGVVYYDGTRLVTTTVGTATNVLTSNGAGMAPSFQALPSSGALVLLKTLTASSSSSLIFTSTYITSAYKTYFIKFSNLYTSAGGVLNMDISADNGSTYKTDNNSGTINNGWSSNTWTNTNATTTNPLIDGSNGTYNLSGQMWIHGLASSAGGTTGPVWTGQCFRPFNNISFYGTNNNGYNINNLKFSMASGTITSGTISLYGVAE